MPTAVFLESSIQGASTAARTDLPAERVILAHLLDQHPRRLTLEQLSGEIAPSFGDGSVRRALEKLTAAQFLSREGTAWIPSKAAIDFDRGSAAEDL